MKLYSSRTFGKRESWRNSRGGHLGGRCQPSITGRRLVSPNTAQMSRANRFDAFEIAFFFVNVHIRIVISGDPALIHSITLQPSLDKILKMLSRQR